MLWLFVWREELKKIQSSSASLDVRKRRLDAGAGTEDGTPVDSEDESSMDIISSTEAGDEHFNSNNRDGDDQISDVE